MELADLKRDVFQPVAKRLRERADSLQQVARLFREERNNIGIEGWLKVEVAAALGEKVARLHSGRCGGPDVSLVTGDKIELKAATDLNLVYIREGCTKYGVPCMFLGDGRDAARKLAIPPSGTVLIAYEIFTDGSNDWVIGMIAPEQ